MEIKQINLQASHIDLTWADGRVSQFHYLWLRDNCITGRHPIVGERISDPMTLPLDLAAQDASIADNGSLKIVWANDG